jgi:microcompartment protein CcmL/EutN
VESADAMVKTAKVRLLASNPVCPGKYVILVGGEVAEVNAAVAAGTTTAADTLVDTLVIPNLHPQVLEAFTASTAPEKVDAIGMIETFSMAAAIVAGDAAVKSAQVTLLEIRLARALGGKGYVLLTGEVSAVRAAVDAGIRVAGEQGLLLGSTVIPSPHPDLVANLL